MKANKNNERTNEYYIGLDIGTNSVGFAATDTDYVIKKHTGKGMWGVRLFDEGETAVTRRTNRTNRRRLTRRNQRLELLRMLFDKEITKIDSGFFLRLKESFLCLEDKTKGTKYSLFADDDFTDKDYLKKYHTVYHLRQELITSKEPHDIRLVYLAIRHIIKNRGHFLFDVDSENNRDFLNVFNDFVVSLEEIKEISLDVDVSQIYEIITKKASKPDRVKALASLIKIVEKEEKKSVEKLFSLMVGGTAKMSDIFAGVPQTSLCFDMGDEKMLEIADEIGDDFDLIISAKAVYDCLILEKIIKGYKTLSEYKISEYKQHKKDIQALKDFVKITLSNKELYKEIFKTQKAKLTNYAAYSGYKKSDKEQSCTQQEFCKYLKGKLPKEYENDERFSSIYQRVNEGVFAPKQRTIENGVIPNSLHRSELVAILENASSYLDFLNESDENGLTVKDKIISIFDYRIPYYVGKLKGGWAVKKEEGKIYPWNFESKISLDKSAERFIEEMTSTCTYTGEDVLPKNSLLYSEFEVLNEINNLKINGAPITVECKKLIFERLFVLNSKKVTKKAIEGLLLSEGLLQKGDALSGVDDNIKSQLLSYHKMKNIIAKTSYEQTEEIIKRIVLFGDDKKLLKNYLKKETTLNDDDIKYVLRQKFTGWGRLSIYLLNGMVSVNKDTGEAMTVIEMLRETNENLMKLLSSAYSFKEQADNHKAEILGIKGTPKEMVDALYVSPKIRRSIWQALRIVDEIVDIEKGAPKKIFIEVARENETDEQKRKNEASRKARKEQLIQLYKDCKENSTDLFKRLNDEDEEKLRSKKLYLYYLQFGKCMYSGKDIELSELDKYDIDHIYPRSKIKDDSFDNLVLVKAELNREKTNKYPISEDIRNNMKDFWSLLKSRGTLSERKYERLVRHTPLSADELAAFVNRQLVETRQSTKAVAELLKTIYPKTKIVYSKANNISDFRKYYDFVKCREINDHHHAKDAYLNVVVGNYFDVRFTQDFIKNIQAEEYSLNVDALYNRNVTGAWQKGENGTIATVNKMMAKNNVLFTVMPKEEKGQLYKVTILKKGDNLIPIKVGMDTEKYGGYNSAKGAYFSVVEHAEKGKKIRTIEAVLAYQKKEYEANPELYARKYWYDNSTVIFPQILVSSLIQIDGVKYNIRGRKPGRIIYSHSHQFVLDNESVKYIKKIIKCLEKEKEMTEEKLVQSGLSKEGNLYIYNLFIDRIDNSIYKKIIDSVSEYMKKNRDKFIKMDLLEQAKFIFEALKAFRCDASVPSFVSTITKNKKISGSESVYLIHQSVTGIFETKIDLLK
ncbi:MAG: type II CRISPR RNA-guided endonuclease Cas9 [Clostridia bacterium]|nr:type II CRISPR RNA-guided endonuclease Cas9 [Clostridia bacterium]